MKAKQIAALLLALALLVSVFAACGNDDVSSSSGAGGTSSESSAGGSDDTSEPESGGASTDDDGEIHPMRIVQPGNLSTEHDKGMAAVNEKLKGAGRWACALFILTCL